MGKPLNALAFLVTEATMVTSIAEGSAESPGGSRKSEDSPVL